MSLILCLSFVAITTYRMTTWELSNYRESREETNSLKKIVRPFFLSSGLPFFTEQTNMSPTQAAGSLLSLPRIPYTPITNRFLAPVLSAQFITAPTGRPAKSAIFIVFFFKFPRSRQRLNQSLVRTPLCINFL